jgi:hypothetical protein
MRFAIKHRPSAERSGNGFLVAHALGCRHPEVSQCEAARDSYFPNGESPKNVSVETSPVFLSRTVTIVTSLRRLIVTLLSFDTAVFNDPIFSPLLLM